MLVNNARRIWQRKSSAASFPPSLPSAFLTTQQDVLPAYYQTVDPETLAEEGFRRALQLFYSASERVPAYKDFLKKHGVNPALIKTKEDFKEVPVVNKHNYLRAYPLQDLLWDGKLDNLFILSSSSGSTGEPFLWPRGEEQELEGGMNFEMMFGSVFGADKLSTLYVISFAMGTWISGPFVLACAENLCRKGYVITSVTPGIETSIALSLIKNLASSYEQIVISGYPPFVKDLLDLGEQEGIKWKDHQVKFLFAAEGFSEKFRDYIHEKVGATDPLTTSLNIYGSADAAVLAHETPLTTKIRRLIADNPEHIEELFQDKRLPTLAQYDPRLKYFEVLSDNSLIFTTRSGIPLIRYAIGDTGGIYQYHEMEKKLAELGITLSEVFSQKDKKFLWKMPFVYVFGRSDLTVSLYGLLVYPEHIKYGLERSGLSREISGKFVMSIEYNAKQNQYLLIRVELAQGATSTAMLSEKVQKAIVEGLRSVNSEYLKLAASIGDKAVPHIELIENSNTEYFKRGAKQRWVKKTV